MDNFLLDDGGQVQKMRLKLRNKSDKDDGVVPVPEVLTRHYRTFLIITEFNER
jgi:hypothetical protein